MFMFSVLIRSYRRGVESRERRDFRFTDFARAESARRVWIGTPERFPVSPIVRMTGGAK